MKRLIKRWLGLNKIESRLNNIEPKLSNILQSNDVIINFRDKRIYKGRLQELSIKEAFVNDEAEFTIKFKAVK